MASHSFMLPGGKRLRFENPEGLYPVNAYQSEIFAQAAVGVAYAMAAEQAGGLGALKAKELCAGNGPAAIALKAIGVGEVHATDINPDARAATQKNAALNGVTLKRIAGEDIRGTVSGPRDYDLIAVNPPCARAGVCPESAGAAVQRAVDGGAEGIDYFQHAVRFGYMQLKPGGRLVIGLTSTMDIPAALAALGQYFGADDCYAVSGTPHAAPFAPLNPEASGGIIGSRDRGAQEIRYAEETGRSMAWDGGDGNAWRNTWFIVARKVADANRLPSGKNMELPLKPNGWPDNLMPENFRIAAQRLQAKLGELGLG